MKRVKGKRQKGTKVKEDTQCDKASDGEREREFGGLGPDGKGEEGLSPMGQEWMQVRMDGRLMEGSQPTG